jgi:hypothetical protein
MLSAIDGFGAGPSATEVPLERGRAFSSLTGSRPLAATGLLVENGFLKGGILCMDGYVIEVKTCTKPNVSSMGVEQIKC